MIITFVQSEIGPTLEIFYPWLSKIPYLNCLPKQMMSSDLNTISSKVSPFVDHILSGSRSVRPHPFLIPRRSIIFLKADTGSTILSLVIYLIAHKLMSSIHLFEFSRCSPVKHTSPGSFLSWPNLLLLFVCSRKSLRRPRDGMPIFIATFSSWDRGGSKFASLLKQDYTLKYLTSCLKAMLLEGRRRPPLKFGTRAVSHTGCLEPRATFAGWGLVFIPPPEVE